MPAFDFDYTRRIWIKECPTCKMEYTANVNTADEAYTAFLTYFSAYTGTTSDGLRYHCKECVSHRANGRIDGSKSRAAMLAVQGNCCFLCCKQITAKGSSAYIDHNHKTGKTRKLLCPTCNTKMAGVDDEEWLIKAIAYRDSFR